MLGVPFVWPAYVVLCRLTLVERMLVAENHVLWSKTRAGGIWVQTLALEHLAKRLVGKPSRRRNRARIRSGAQRSIVSPRLKRAEGT